MQEITAAFRQLAIIGDPVEHSFSPQLHNYLAEKMQLPYVYTAWHVTPEHLEDAIRGVRALGIAGINVTAPHKFKVIQYLDEIDPRAEMLGSVNTVVNRGGRLIGYNTDADGFYMSLKKVGTEVFGKDILIFGAGGATQPIAVLFALEHAKSITILNRTKTRAEQLASYVRKATGFQVQTERTLPRYDLVINTTAAGMHPQEDASPTEDYSMFDKSTTAADLIYNPEKTVFLQHAEAAGAAIVNGLGMLIFQGLLAFEHFTGKKLYENAYEDVKKEVFGK